MKIKFNIDSLNDPKYSSVSDPIIEKVIRDSYEYVIESVKFNTGTRLINIKYTNGLIRDVSPQELETKIRIAESKAK